MAWASLLGAWAKGLEGTICSPSIVGENPTSRARFLERPAASLGCFLRSHQKTGDRCPGHGPAEASETWARTGTLPTLRTAYRKQ